MADPWTLRFWFFALVGGLALSLWWRADDRAGSAEPPSPPGAIEQTAIPDPPAFSPEPQRSAQPQRSAPPRPLAPTPEPLPEREPSAETEPEAPARAPRESDYGLTGDARLALDAYRRAGSDPDARQEAIFLLALEEQPEVLDFLLDEYSNVPPEERGVMIEAIVQFGNPRAAERLRQMAQQADAEEERMLLNEAAHFLSIPEFGEMLEELKRLEELEEEN